MNSIDVPWEGENKQLSRSQVIVTTRIKVAINNQLFFLMTKLYNCPQNLYHLEKALICEPNHMTIWDPKQYREGSTCHQDNNLIVNRGCDNILEKALQEIPLEAE